MRNAKILTLLLASVLSNYRASAGQAQEVGNDEGGGVKDVARIVNSQTFISNALEKRAKEFVRSNTGWNIGDANFPLIYRFAPLTPAPTKLEVLTRHSLACRIGPRPLECSGAGFVP